MCVCTLAISLFIEDWVEWVLNPFLIVQTKIPIQLKTTFDDFFFKFLNFVFYFCHCYFLQQ